MKKTVLSLSLIFVFAAYTLYVRIIGTDVPFVLMSETNKPQTTLLLPSYNKTTQNSAPTPTTIPTTKPTPANSAPVINNGKYRDGEYIGDVVDAYYGNVQVKIVISGGKITDVQFLNYPKDRQTSVRINSRAMPYLISEAIVAQDANVDTVSGASFTSTAFRKSLSGALAQAKI